MPAQGARENPALAPCQGRGAVGFPLHGESHPSPSPWSRTQQDLLFHTHSNTCAELNVPGLPKIAFLKR